MPIVCPQCSTSYAVDPATLGAGRHVRCVRCKQVWLARPPSLLVLATSTYAAELVDAPDDRAQSTAAGDIEPPQIESPSLAVDWPSEEGRELVTMREAGFGALVEAQANEPAFPPKPVRAKPKKKARSMLPTAALAMSALLAALLVWRAEMVRLMPQTAGFYRIIGLDVNQRGLKFRDVRLSTETVEGTPVLIVEGNIESLRRAPVAIPVLHFAVRNAQGATIYGWNTQLDQTALKPGETAPFRSRLASPPADAHSIDVRFLHKRDLATGAA